MPVIRVYQGQQAPESFKASIYLIGATAESGHSQWRATVLRLLEETHYNGVVSPPATSWCNT